MWRVLDGEDRAVSIPADRVMLTRLLAERLDVQVGDRVVVERKDGDHAVLGVTVAALVDDRAGMNAFMQLDTLAHAFGEEPRASVVLLAIDRTQRGRLLDALADVPAVVGIADAREIREALAAQMGEVMLVWTMIVILFAVVIAVGVIYNNARVALSERARDLATLRVLGYTRTEVSTVLLGQLAWQTIVALPLGLLFGYGLATLFMSLMDPEQYRMPATVAASTYALAALVVIGASLLTGVVVKRRLDHIDLNDALKARD
jgi:putative ABC transport system permease protein